MTREEIKNTPEIVDFLLDESVTLDSRMKLHKRLEELCKLANKALEREPLTDTEQRIFLAAMSREEKVCKEVCADGEGKDLVAVCHQIERKVKKALWE